MKLIKLKWLKVIGIIAIVAGILALATWGIIASMKREKNYLGAFSSSVEAEIDTDFEAFNSLETKSPELFNFCDLQLTLRALENKNVSERLNLLKSNFAVIGLNYNERKEVDSIVSNLGSYRTSLTTIYAQLKEISEKDVIDAADMVLFKNILKESYVTNYDLIIAEKTHLLKVLKTSLDNHKTYEPSYIDSIFELSDMAIDITQKVHLSHIKTYGTAEASTGYSNSLLESLNITLESINAHTKNYTADNIADLIAGLAASTKSLKAQYNSFLENFNGLTAEEKQVLLNGGAGFDYTITPTQPRLIAVVEFLKADGIYKEALGSDGAIMKGIQL